ncbi:threonine-phosphate decarboxylase CobD [Neobacillus pocheonensis]|uniref:threonine-phosphate decarboxylase CobD n=1 Tax=Neobacillus pocheonensis TaxID=363869 RepID=UPI003D2D70B9
MLPSHGSNPQYLYESLGLSLPQQYIDFSANINPLGPPQQLKDKWPEIYQEVMVYPDPYAIKLKTIIARKEQISVNSILIGNGGSELITIVARMLAGKKVLLVQPAFSEYETACRANNCEVSHYQLIEHDFELNLDELRGQLVNADALFLCSPSNPTGIQFSAATILSILEESEKHDCLVLLDEAFYDFLIEYDSVLPYINRFSNFIIIRSLTKMYAIPGIRLGYLAAQPNMVARLSSLQSHWSTNAIALIAGEICLQDDSFIKQTQSYIQHERQRLFTFFKQQEFTFSSSKVNYYLLKDPFSQDQFPLFQFLLKRGIIPRHTYNFLGLDGKWLRFAIRSQEENNRLIEVLSEWRATHP